MKTTIPIENKDTTSKKQGANNKTTKGSKKKLLANNSEQEKMVITTPIDQNSSNKKKKLSGEGFPEILPFKTTTKVKSTFAKPDIGKSKSISSNPSYKVVSKSSPAAYAKASFEDQISMAIKESIARRKDNNRAYDEKIINDLKKIISNYTESPELLDGIEHNTDTNFLEQLNIDSVDFVEIIVDTEETFSIKLEDEEVKKLRAFDDLYDLIVCKIQEP